jgi:hypothetical protein
MPSDIEDNDNDQTNRSSRDENGLSDGAEDDNDDYDQTMHSGFSRDEEEEENEEDGEGRNDDVEEEDSSFSDDSDDFNLDDNKDEEDGITDYERCVSLYYSE